ncbi:MAG: MotA/TolQ/ExbB proton channel family protein [Chlamydiae bacterium CG10_big_fil_rev_8_21_14_0_10_35_9]|nr:MAG: MotA/TolQ/ExbB proton channel family protein [Chlamydiae bacterium CG10_big_fil_rev_8_21_14_0_10_35_9]
MHIIAFSPLINSFKQSDFFGKLIFFSLFILSILSWIIILYKFWLTKKARSSSVSFENILHNQKNNLLNLNFNHMDSNPFLEIFDSLKIHAIEILDKNRFFLQKQENNSSQNFLTDIDLQLVESHLISKISKEIQSFEKNLFILSTIVTLAPFLGLLGTVWGILITFSNLSSNILSNSNMLSGLSMALGTTVLGLLVAIPALIGHNFLKNLLRDYQKQMESFAQKLLATLEIQYRKVELL